MIYDIDNSDIEQAMTSGAIILCWNTIGTRALVLTDSTDFVIDSIASYDNNAIDELMSRSEWQQPCVNCEITK